MPKSGMKKLRAAAARFRKEEPGLYRKMAFEISLRAKVILNPEKPINILFRETIQEQCHV